MLLRSLTVFALLGLSAPVAETEESPGPTHTVLKRLAVDPERTDGSSLLVAPQSAHIAFRLRLDDGTAWAVDGLPGQAYDELGPLVFSADGAHWAYLARKGERWWLVRDGKAVELPYALLSARSLLLSADGARVAFQASRRTDGAPAGEVIVLDGAEGPAFAGIRSSTLAFSPDGKRLLYVAMDAAGERVVVDGQAGDTVPHDTIGKPVWSADSTRVAHVLRDRKGDVVVVDGTKQGPYLAVTGLRFAPQGARYLYVVGGAGQEKACVVVDGVPGPLYDDLGAPGPVFSADGRRVGYLARKGEGFLAVVDGKEGALYPRVGAGSLRLSADGKRHAYWAGRGPKPFFVIDGVEQPEVDLVSDSVSFAFSPDGKRVCYAAQQGGAWTLITDGQPGLALEGVGKEYPLFSPDGKHVVAQARHKGRWVLLQDGVASAPVDGFAEGGVAFGTDGATCCCAARVNRSWHLCIAGRLAPEPFDTLLPGSVPVANGPRSFHAWVLKGGEILHLQAALAP